MGTPMGHCAVQVTGMFVETSSLCLLSSPSYGPRWPPCCPQATPIGQAGAENRQLVTNLLTYICPQFFMSFFPLHGDLLPLGSHHCPSGAKWMQRRGEELLGGTGRSWEWDHGSNGGI